MKNDSISNDLTNRENHIFIDLLNRCSGTVYPRAEVCGGNTLGQLIEAYGEQDLGINPKDDKIQFINKRTGDETSDLNATISDLHLEDGDVLAISDNAGVA